MAMLSPEAMQNIKHVVVLMMENRSFDHVFGDFPNVNGIQPDMVNYQNPSTGNGGPTGPVSVMPIDVNTQPNFNPNHSFPGMMCDIFGPGAIGFVGGQVIWGDNQGPYQPEYMGGFVAKNPNEACSVMSYFKYLQPGDPGRLKVLHGLAENFVLCDNWFCDTPSETFPNRFFMHSATNYGYNNSNPSGGNPDWGQPESGEGGDVFNAKTIYESLDGINAPGEGETNWAMYGFPRDEYDSSMYSYTFPEDYTSPRFINANRSIFDFPIDALTGNLPFYTFIMPSLLYGSSWANGNSMHPNGDIRLGENYIASVYNVLRNSPLWEHTLLIVTFDENGGIFDHVMPPNATPPDEIYYPHGASHEEALFDYSMLGPRIPALLISPWVEKNQVDSTQYQNTSILRFAQDLFSAQNSFSPAPSLTNRDASAPSFAGSDYWLSSPRSDCPEIMELHAGFPNWGTEMVGFQVPSGSSQFNPGDYDLYSGPYIGASPPPLQGATALEFARQFCAHLPGHPDSGKPLTRAFVSKAELLEYMDERRNAAWKFYAQRRG